MGFPRRLLALVLSSILLLQATLSPLTSVVAYAESRGAGFGEDDGELRIAVLSDMHYYPVNFVSDCADYTTYVGGDPKMLEESGSIADAALEMVREDDPDILIVSGDLTKDGEIQGHRDLAAKFQELEDETETEVFVINGNHDVYNYLDACTFENGYKESAQTTTPDEFKEIYANFGYNGEFDAQYFANPVSDEQAGELSYTVDLGRFTIVAIDSGMYSPDAGTGYDTNEHITAGRVDEDLLPWVTDRIEEADAEGDTVIGLMHHGVVPHFEGEENLLSEYVVEDWRNVATVFADAGMRYVFTGHMHANDIAEYTTPTGNTIYDLETGSLASYGSPVRSVTVTKGEPLGDGTQRTHETFSVSTNGVESISFEDHNGTVTEISDFGQYTMDKLYSPQLLNNMANGMLRPMLQEIGETGVVNYLNASFPELDLDSTVLEAVRGFLATPMSIELGSGIGRVNIRYANGGIQIEPSGTAGALIDDATITDAQILAVVYDVIDQVEARYVDNPDQLLGAVDELVTKVSNFGVESLDSSERTLYDFLVLILTGHYAGAENPPSWVENAQSYIQSGEIVTNLIDMLLDSLIDDPSSIVNDLLNNTYIDIDSLDLAWLLETALNEATDDGRLATIASTFGLDIRGLVEGLVSEYMSPSFLTGMGGLIWDIASGMLYDDTQDDAIGGEGRTITFDGTLSPQPATVENGLAPTQLTMTLGSDPLATRNLRWYTGTAVGESAVRVSESADMSGAREIAAVSTEVVKPDPQMNLGLITTYGTQDATEHSATIDGLELGKTYYYQVGDFEHGWTSEVIAFTCGSAAEDSFTFINVNDSQGMIESDYDTYLATLAAADAAFPDASFAIHGGDFVDDGANEDYWSWALDDEVSSSLAFVPVTGNHEERSEVEGITYDNPVQAHFNLADVPEQDLSTGAYYSFEYKNALFIVLNTNDLEGDQLSAEQVQWAIATASESDAAWKIIAMHKSPYSNGPHAQDDDVVAIRGQIDAICSSCDIDLVLSGHDHVYNRTPYLVNGEDANVAEVTTTYQGQNYSTAYNPEGTMFVIAGTAGVKNYEQDTAAGVPSKVNLDLDVPVYTGITVDGDALYYRAYTVSGGVSTLVDSFAISKAEDEQTAPWQNVVDMIDALPAVNDITTGDAGEIQAARAAYDALDAEGQAQVTNLAKLENAEKMLATLQAVANKRTVTVTNHDDFTEAINDPTVGTIITQGTIEFDEGGLFSDGDREIYVDRDVVVGGTGTLRYCRFHVRNGATLILEDSVYVNDTRSQGSFYDALNPVEVEANSTLITRDSVSLRTEYGQGGSDEGVAVKLIGNGATAILGSSGGYWGAEAAVYSTVADSHIVIEDGTFGLKNNSHSAVDSPGTIEVRGGEIASLWCGGTLTVTGGEFAHQDSASNTRKPVQFDGSNMYVTGGTFTSYDGAAIQLGGSSRVHIMANIQGAVTIDGKEPFVSGIQTSNYRDVSATYNQIAGTGSNDGIYRLDATFESATLEQLAGAAATRLDGSVADGAMSAQVPTGESTVFARYQLSGDGKSLGGITGGAGVYVYGPARNIENVAVESAVITGDETRVVELSGGAFQLTGYTLPANAFDNAVTWSVDRDDVLSLASNYTIAQVNPVAAGLATVTMTADSNPAASDSVKVFVVDPEIEGPDAIEADAPAQTYTASAGFTGEGADRVAFRWSVDDTDIATIDRETGELEVVSRGTVTITADLFVDGASTGVSVTKDVVVNAAPQAPAVKDVNALLDVQVADVNEDMASEHVAQTFETLISNSEGANDSYTIGKVYSEDAAAANPLEAFTNLLGVTRAAKVYKADVTIQAAPYVAAFDEALGLEAGTHELEGDESVTVTLVWSDGDPSAEPAVEAGWTLADPDAATVVFEVMCRGAQAAPVLTVTPGAEHATVTVTGADGATLHGDIQWSDYETDWSPNTFQTLEPGTNELEVDEGGTFYFRAAGDATHDPSGVASVTITKVTFKVNEGEGSFAEGSPTTWYLESGEAVGADNMPTAIRDGYVFAGWKTADGAAFDGTATVTAETTVTAQWTQLAAITVTPSEGNTAYTYDGLAKAFGFTAVPEGVATNSFTVEYRAADAAETDPWTSEAPVDAGTYDVRVTRAADGTYEAYSQVFEGGLEIAKATYAIPDVRYAKGDAEGTVRIILQNGDADMYCWSERDDLSNALEAENNEFEVGDAGTYYVFAPADKNHEASEVKEVKVIKVTFDDGDGVAGDEDEGAAFADGATEVLMAPGHALRSWGGMPKVSWEGHELVGWAAPDGSAVTDLTAIKESTTLTAQWNPPAPEPGPVAPAAPTADQVAQLTGISVSLHGVNELNSEDAEGAHPDVTYSAGGENALIADSFAVAEPVQDEETDAWTVQVTLDGGAYLDAYSQQYGKHYFADSDDQRGERTFILAYDEGAGAWAVADGEDASFTFDITCLTLRPAEAEKYTGGESDTGGHFVDQYVVDGQGEAYTIAELNALLDGQTARVAYFDGSGAEIANDTVPGTYEARIVLDGGSRSGDQAVVTIDGTEYAYTLEPSELVIRSVSDSAEAERGGLNVDLLTATDAESVQAALAEAAGGVVASLPAGTTVNFNGDADVPLADTSGVTLLSDDLLPGRREDELVAHAEEQLGVEIGSADTYDFQYLDLVDETQSNAWVSSTLGTDVHWRIPEGADPLSVRVYHFAGLHRDYDADDAEVSDLIAASTVETVPVQVDGESGYASFHVDQSGFSPFLMTWEQERDPGVDPGTGPADDPEGPGVDASAPDSDTQEEATEPLAETGDPTPSPVALAAVATLALVLALLIAKRGSDPI